MRGALCRLVALLVLWAPAAPGFGQDQAGSKLPVDGCGLIEGFQGPKMSFLPCR